MQVNQGNLSALFKGYRVIFMEAYQGGAPSWPRLAMRTTSASAEEIYHWLGAVPGMEELLGEVAIRNLSAHRFSIPNKEYQATVGIKRTDIERDTYGVYNPLISSMGLAAAQHPDELLATLMIRGFDDDDYTGSPFFSANKKATPDSKFPFTNLGTKKLSGPNFETARANVKGRLNALGRPMNLGRDLVLIVSPKNESVGRSILQGDFVQATANSLGGVSSITNVNKGTARLEVWPQLSAAGEDAWFLIEAGYPVKPFIVQVEKEAMPQQVTNLDDSHVLLKQEFLYQVYGRYAAGYALPELAYGSDGSQAA